MSGDQLPKFCLPDGRPVHRNNVFRLEPANGQRARLVVTTEDSPVDLIGDIVRDWPGPYVVLYVLIVTRSDVETARYQSPWLDDFRCAEDFLIRFRNFFEQDGRHAIWLATPDHGLQIVYDRHEILSVYGDSSRVLEMLKERGFQEGKAHIPIPHAHHYHGQFDQDFSALMDWWQWQPSPLQPDDER